MPRLAEVFCYAHSGGLPRDLIRVARRIATDAHGAAIGATLPTLIRPLLQLDVEGQLEAALQNEDDTMAQLRTTAVPLFADAVRKALHDPRQLSAICQEFRQPSPPSDGDRSIADAASVPAGVLSGVYLLATLGELFCDESTRPIRTEAAHRDTFIEALEQLARARQSLHSHPEVAWAAIREARVHIRLPVEQTAALSDWRDASAYL
jgi:hypothetical protein